MYATVRIVTTIQVAVDIYIALRQINRSDWELLRC